MLKLASLAIISTVETSNSSLRKRNYLCSQIDVECTQSTTNKSYIVGLKTKTQEYRNSSCVYNFTAKFEK